MDLCNEDLKSRITNKKNAKVQKVLEAMQNAIDAEVKEPTAFRRRQQKIEKRRLLRRHVMLSQNINDITVGGNPARKKIKKKKKKKTRTLHKTVKIVRRSMLKRTSQLEDQLIQYWHRINIQEDQHK